MTFLFQESIVDNLLPSQHLGENILGKSCFSCPAIMNYARKYYKLPENPVVICGSMGKSQAESMKFGTLGEFKQFIPAIEDKLLSKVMFDLLFWTGMRSGELLALTLNDFDFEVKTISKNFIRLNGEDLILTPKTPKSKRTITLPDFICDMVQDYAAHLYDYKPKERLFPVTKHYLAMKCVGAAKN